MIVIEYSFFIHLDLLSLYLHCLSLNHVWIGDRILNFNIGRSITSTVNSISIWAFLKTRRSPKFLRDYRNFFWKSGVEYFFWVGNMFYGILLPHRCRNKSLYVIYKVLFIFSLFKFIYIVPTDIYSCGWWIFYSHFQYYLRIQRRISYKMAS